LVKCEEPSSSGFPLRVPQPIFRKVRLRISSILRVCFCIDPDVDKLAPLFDERCLA
jgi:hypothetical protein